MQSIQSIQSIQNKAALYSYHMIYDELLHLFNTVIKESINEQIQNIYNKNLHDYDTDEIILCFNRNILYKQDNEEFYCYLDWTLDDHIIAVLLIYEFHHNDTFKENYFTPNGGLLTFEYYKTIYEYLINKKLI